MDVSLRLPGPQRARRGSVDPGRALAESITLEGKARGKAAVRRSRESDHVAMPWAVAVRWAAQLPLYLLLCLRLVSNVRRAPSPPEGLASSALALATASRP